MEITSVDPVCEDLCYGILEKLPSRSLVQIRSTSRIFSDLVDEILRRRFLDIVASGANELVPLTFSHFGPAVDRALVGDIAHMRTKANGCERIPYFLPLGDGEVFANNHLAIHLRQCDSLLSFDDDGFSAMQLARPLQPRGGYGYVNSIKVATSLDRFFRSWFIDPASEPDWSAAWYSPSAPATPTSSPESTPWTSRESSPSPFLSAASAMHGDQKRPTRPRRIRANQSSQSGSALYGAQIDCIQVPASDIEFNHADTFFYTSSSSSSSTSPPGSRFHPSPTSIPRLYEYSFDTIELDVAKVVVAAEENMPSCLYPRAGHHPASPYIFVL
ncbi:hypothetical protein C6P46_003824 [Rhodotorula mucilaginosa]|uniref:F-box domain-containing protein n=1 Tax=Rhodotorula mucilaginosa TaxID=5537 RepID=A0A9P7B6P2_RHOMI|nr:hypothetical protein C6P46_003824 [Rhodotorula mucilaginosa]